MPVIGPSANFQKMITKRINAISWTTKFAALIPNASMGAPVLLTIACRLTPSAARGPALVAARLRRHRLRGGEPTLPHPAWPDQIGRASCRERVYIRV